MIPGLGRSEVVMKFTQIYDPCNSVDVHQTFPMGLIGMFDHPSSKILGYIMGYIQYAPTEIYHK